MTKQRIASASVAASIFLFAAAVSFLAMRPGSPAQYYHDVVSLSVEPAAVSVTDQVTTHVVIKRRTPSGVVCSIELHRFIVDQDGFVVMSQIIPGIAEPQPSGGVEKISRRFKLPPDLRPGRYCYSFRAFNNCGGAIFTAQSPQACFEVAQ